MMVPVTGDCSDLWNVDTIDCTTDGDGESQDIFPTTAFYRDKQKQEFGHKNLYTSVQIQR